MSIDTAERLALEEAAARVTEAPGYTRLVTATITRPAQARRWVAVRVAVVAACVVLTLAEEWRPWCLVPAGLIGLAAAGGFYRLPVVIRRLRADR